MFDPQGRLLLLQRHRDDWGGGLWATPAGGLEAGESPHQAILREVHEETGIRLPSAEPLGVHLITMPHGSVRMQSFRAALDRPVRIRLSPEEHEAHDWFELRALLDQPNIIWATPTILRDFKLLPDFDIDPTLADGSTAVLLR